MRYYIVLTQYYQPTEKNTKRRLNENKANTKSFNPIRMCIVHICARVCGYC